MGIAASAQSLRRSCQERNTLYRLRLETAVEGLSTPKSQVL